MNIGIRYHIETVNVEEIVNKNQRIEYKSIDVEEYKKDGYQVLKSIIKVDQSKYLTDVIEARIDLDEVATEVLNISTGMGKTTAIYNMVKRLYDQQDSVIILATSFISLVDKDYTYLTREPYAIAEEHILDYRKLKKELETMRKKDSTNLALFASNKIAYDKMFTDGKKLHIITVHSLLGNPGDTAFEQSLHKRNYLDSLINYCRSEKKKVYLFIDEIHASIDNFQNQFIYNLTRWKGLVYKCFVSTATFTEPVNIVIKHLSYLTDDRINILENQRIKNQKCAELSILFTKQTYSKSDFDDLDQFFPNWLKDNGFQDVNATKNFHILCYSRNIAKAIYKHKDKKTDHHYWWGSRKDVNLVVGRGDGIGEFDNRVCNIGTKFSTGVNIRNSEDVFIIIFPCRYSSEYTKGEEGIFTSGIPSLIQSVARLRNGGKMIFVIPPMPEMIQCKEFEILKQLVPSLFAETAENKSLSFDKESAILDKLIQRKTQRIEEEKQRYEQDIATKKVVRPNIQFPTKETFILERGQEYLKYVNLKSGRSVTPYVLWASLNNQFCNLDLKQIHYFEYKYITVRLYTTKMEEGLERQARRVHSIDWENMDIHLIYSKLRRSFFQIEENGIIYRVNLYIDDKLCPSTKKLKTVGDRCMLYDFIFKKIGGHIRVKTKSDYIYAMIAHSIEGKKDSTISNAYIGLNNIIQSTYKNFKGQHYMLADVILDEYFSDELVAHLGSVLHILKHEDPFLRQTKFFNIDLYNREAIIKQFCSQIMKRGNRNKRGAKQFMM